MEVLGLGWQTDLALLQHAGSVVEHHPTYAVVRTPDNLTFRWGNFVLLRKAPLRRDAQRVLDLVAAELPAVRHVAIGVDDATATVDDVDGLVHLGLTASTSTVLTAACLTAPRPVAEITLRPLLTDADWAARLELALDVAGNHRLAQATFATRRNRAQRRLVDDGHGAWFGAFSAGRLVSSLGVVRATTTVARYQEVETHPGWRRRGLAGALVVAAGRHALDELGVTTLVIVADPAYPAVRLYRSLGFTDAESQVQVERG